MISIEMLPAAHGDALWIEYGSKGQTRRILIDGGPAHSYEAGLRKRIQSLPEKKRDFELIIVTHIDADHIDGALIMLQENTSASLKITTKEFWFNGWNQLPKLEVDTYAPLQGEFLGGLLTVDTALNKAWNKQFKKGAVMIPDEGSLPEIELEGGARITLLGPGYKELRRLRARWVSAIRDFTPGDVQEALRRLKERREYRPPAFPSVFAAKQYGDDRTPANGSSISFLLEDGGASVLLLGDAHASTLVSSLGRLVAQRAGKRLKVDAVKLPHHGSMGNVSKEWLQMVDCDRWLISTNGAIFGHPDIDTVKLIAENCSRKPTIYCNYLSDTTRRLQNKAGWRVAFPATIKSSQQVGYVLQLNGSTSKRNSRPKSTSKATSKKRKAKIIVASN
jgi:beta-lactamase superfamily II metal-dependent hydrolase